MVTNLQRNPLYRTLMTALLAVAAYLAIEAFKGSILNQPFLFDDVTLAWATPTAFLIVGPFVFWLPIRRFTALMTVYACTIALFCSLLVGFISILVLPMMLSHLKAIPMSAYPAWLLHEPGNTILATLLFFTGFAINTSICWLFCFRVLALQTKALVIGGMIAGLLLLFLAVCSFIFAWQIEDFVRYASLRNTVICGAILLALVIPTFVMKRKFLWQTKLE